MQEQLAALTDRIDLSLNVARREGEERIYSAFERRMAALDVVDLEERFAAAFVSNPRSGEFVKGHAVVLAELGLCPYRGQVVRDPAVFAGGCSKARRAAHLVARLGFIQQLWFSLGSESVALYRGLASDGPLPPARPTLESQRELPRRRMRRSGHDF